MITQEQGVRLCQLAEQIAATRAETAAHNVRYARMDVDKPADYSKSNAVSTEFAKFVMSLIEE